jgi:hypothetical protein
MAKELGAWNSRSKTSSDLNSDPFLRRPCKTGMNWIEGKKQGKDHLVYAEGR